VNTIKPIHPFPARMAPELAIAALNDLDCNSFVLDPMAGSGTVLRHASEFGHRASGFDMDPLAVLMSKVWTTPVSDVAIERLLKDVIRKAGKFTGKSKLSWIDEDEETMRFIDFWFAEPQRSNLRRIACILSQPQKLSVNDEKQAAADVLRIALSRIIITKEQGASLARDTSHSRPHKVADCSDFNVFQAFEKSANQVRRLLISTPPAGNVNVSLGDARSLNSIENNSVDAVLTSPPYLNAIDYMRGHRLSLVWLGYKLSDLRQIRSCSIGAERGPDLKGKAHLFESIINAMGPVNELQRSHVSMIERYTEDIYRLMSEVTRVLKPNGKAIFVVGNSCLKGIFIQNSESVINAGAMVGLKLMHQVVRELPNRNRYLPMPKGMDEPLGKRMRTENILTFMHTKLT
jgi:DNA modification methylase